MIGTVSIPSFENGEVSKRALGNLNMERYSACLKHLENFIVTPTGSIVRRPGTEYFATPPDGVPLRIISAWNYVVLAMSEDTTLSPSNYWLSSPEKNSIYLNRELTAGTFRKLKLDENNSWHETGETEEDSNQVDGFYTNPIAAMNQTDIAIAGTSLAMWRFDGSTYAKIGSSLALPGSSSPIGIACLNSTDVAVLLSISIANISLAKYRFDGTAWTLIGALLPVDSSAKAICAMSSNRVAITYYPTFKEIRAYDFNGAAWAQTGSSFAISTDLDIAITRLSETEVAVAHGLPASLNKVIQKMAFDGALWSNVGASSVIYSNAGSFNITITSIDENKVVWVDTVTPVLRILTYDSGVWTGLISDFNPAFQSNPIQDLIFYDPYSSQLLQTVDVSTFNIGDEFDYEIIKNVMYIVSESGVCSVTRTPGTTDIFTAGLLGIEDRRWAQKGNSLSLGTITEPALCSLNATDIIEIDNTNDQLRCYRFDGTSFTLIGTSLAVAIVEVPALTSLSVTDFAFLESNLESLRLYQWSGSSFSLIASLAIAGIGAPALSGITSTDVAMIDDTLESLRLYRVSSATWVLVGTGLSIPGILRPALCALNATDVAFIDDTLKSLRLYRWNVLTLTWSQVGSSLSVPGINTPKITKLNETDIALLDSTLHLLRIFRWNGAAFVEIGNSIATVESGGLAMCTLTPNQIVIADEGTDSIRVHALSGNYKCDGTSGHSPKYVSSFEGRLCFAATDSHPTSVFLSKAPTTDLRGDYLTDLTPGALPGDALEMTLRSSDIQWIQGKDFLYVGTESDEWIIQGGQSGIIPGDAFARIVSSEGSRGGVSSVTSLGVCFSKFGNGHIMKNIFSQAIQGYTPGDLVSKAGHINFKYVKRIETQANPWEIIWVLDEAYGRLYALSFTGKQYAISRITSTMNGVDMQVVDIISRATKPVSQSDSQSYELYMLTKRTLNDGSSGYFIERIKGFDLYLEDIFETVPPEDTESVKGYQARPILDLQSRKSATRALGTQTLDLSYIDGESVQLYAVSKETTDGVTEFALHGDLPGTVIASDETAIEKSYYLDEWIVYAGIPVTSNMVTAPIEFQTDAGMTYGKPKQIGRVITRLVDSLGVKIRDYGANTFTEILPEDSPPANQVGPLMTGDSIIESVGTQFRKEIELEIEISKAYPAEITLLIVDVDANV